MGLNSHFLKYFHQGGILFSECSERFAIIDTNGVVTGHDYEEKPLMNSHTGSD